MGNESIEATDFYDDFDLFGLNWDERHVREMLPDIEGKRILDAGCGPGHVAATLAEEGADVVGVDGSENMIAYARENYGGEVAFHHADLSQPLDFLEPASFDAVICLLVLGHVRNRESAFEEFYRILSSKGATIIHTNHPFSDYLDVEHEAEDVSAESATYSNIERFTRSWGPNGEPMPFYRRPLGDFFGPAFDAGLCVDGINEPGVGESTDDRYPDAVPPRHVLIRFRKSNA